MLRGILMKNIKGQNKTQELTGKDIFIGSNGKGKSTRIQALQIAMLGYLPGKAKKLEQIFKLSSSDEMQVGLKTEKFGFTRTITQKASNKKDGSIEKSLKEDIAVYPAKSEKNTTQKQQRVEQEIGNFPVMLNFDEFLSMTDSKRREFIYNLAGVDESAWKKADVEKYLRDKLLIKELRENNPDRYAFMEEGIIGTLKLYNDKFDIQQGITVMCDYIKSQLTYWNNELDKSKGAAKKLAEIKNESTETDKGIEENKAELEKLHQKLVEIEKRLSSDSLKKGLFDKKNSRIKLLEKDIESLKNEKLEDPEEMKKQIESLKSQLQQTDLSKEISEINKNIDYLNSELEKYQKEYNSIREEGVKGKAELAIKKETVSKIQKSAGKCMLDDRINCNKDFRKYIEFTNKEIVNKTRSLIQLGKTYKEKEQRINDTKQKLKKEILEKEKLSAKEKTAFKNNEATNRQIAILEKTILKISSESKLNEEKINSMKTELDKLENEKVDPIVPLELLEKEKSAVEKSIKDLNEKIDNQQKAQISNAVARSSTVDAKKAENYSWSYGIILKQLGNKGLQGEIVKSILEPIRSLIQENLDLMDIKNTFYFETESDGKEVFQFGWIANDQKINFDTLSTGQQMILLVAMVVAFIQKANPKLKMLAIDGVQELDKQNFARFLTGLIGVSDKLDNIILTGVKGNITVDMAEKIGFKIWDLDNEISQPVKNEEPAEEEAI